MTNDLKVSLIVPTYKDLTALKLILNALEKQTYKNFETIIVEDDDIIDTKNFLKSLNTKLEIKHFYHEDDGNRKAIIINKALPNISGDYIIFIDGDCIPFSTFIEYHIKQSSKKTVLCGRRVNLGDKVSRDIRDNIKSPEEIENNYFKNLKYLSNDNSRHLEQGLSFNPSSLIFKFIQKRDSNVHIVGSNFSCFKEDLFFINGFDEDITGGSKDDVDLEWRFVQSGCKLKSCKFSANLFHLNHKRASRVKDEEIARKEMDENKIKNKYICSNGIKKL